MSEQVTLTKQELDDIEAVYGGFRLLVPAVERLLAARMQDLAAENRRLRNENAMLKQTRIDANLLAGQRGNVQWADDAIDPDYDPPPMPASRVPAPAVDQQTERVRALLRDVQKVVNSGGDELDAREVVNRLVAVLLPNVRDQLAVAASELGVVDAVGAALKHQEAS